MQTLLGVVPFQFYYSFSIICRIFSSSLSVFLWMHSLCKTKHVIPFKPVLPAILLQDAFPLSLWCLWHIPFTYYFNLCYRLKIYFFIFYCLCFFSKSWYLLLFTSLQLHLKHFWLRVYSSSAAGLSMALMKNFSEVIDLLQSIGAWKNC